MSLRRQKNKGMKKKIKKCIGCGKEMIPDKKAINFITKKWDKHTYLACKCLGKNWNKYLRISIG